MITGGAAGRLGLALAMALVGICAVAGAAVAIPADGPKPDSAGTSSRVWPKTVAPGGTLNFEVSGFPANESVYIKIDDGQMCSDSSHGACVYHVQRLNKNGYAKGSLRLPADLKPGKHWLRMLGTGDVFDSKTDEKLGYQGYTRRGGNDFTVVAASSGNDTSGPGNDPGTTDQNPAATADDTGDVEAGNLEIDLGDDAAELPEEQEAAATDEEATLPAELTEDPVATPQVVSAPQTETEPPTLGMAILGGAIVIGALIIAWALVSTRRRPSAG